MAVAGWPTCESGAYHYGHDNNKNQTNYWEILSLNFILILEIK
jgi:hypothetical protein